MHLLLSCWALEAVPAAGARPSASAIANTPTARHWLGSLLDDFCTESVTAASRRPGRSVRLDGRPSFFVDRHKSQKGSSCAGLSNEEKNGILSAFDTRAFGSERVRILEPTQLEAMRVGGCQGLRVLVRAASKAGENLFLLVYAVSGIGAATANSTNETSALRRALDGAGL
jgi:hypothetical protein